MLELQDFKAMTETEVDAILKRMKPSDRLHLCEEGKQIRQSENPNRFGYLDKAANAGIYKNGKLAGDKNAREDSWGEIELIIL